MLFEMNPHGRSVLCAVSLWCVFFVIVVLIRNSDTGNHRSSFAGTGPVRGRLSKGAGFGYSASPQSSGQLVALSSTVVSSENITIAVHGGASVVAYNVLGMPPIGPEDEQASQTSVLAEYLLKNVKAARAGHRLALSEDHPGLEYGCNLTDSRVAATVQSRPRNSYFENEGAFTRPRPAGSPSRHAAGGGGDAAFVRVALVSDPIKRLVASFDAAAKEFNLDAGKDRRPPRRRRKFQIPRMAIDKQLLLKLRLKNCGESPRSSQKSALLCSQIVTDSFLVNFFCGCSDRCFSSEGDWALERAKTNIADHFAVVGFVEQVDMYAYVLEKLMPEIFKTTPLPSLSEALSNQNLNSDGNEPQSLRLNQFLEAKLALDFELYAFIKRRFEKQKKALGITTT